ncbi:hypothetical protein M3172_23555 [Mesobacillus subterraneus]|uniref:hypothetical protein n=1 Tax=Mesobacillus subterraneus TaxID=285983 RepID=UPI00203DCC2D|nr:hypothetical protein [Mesobacillus subterraneus]MCM3576151.1 hypothetical protein [Mesobacillus subterraneus]
MFKKCVANLLNTEVKYQNMTRTVKNQKKFGVLAVLGLSLSLTVSSAYASASSFETVPLKETVAVQNESKYIEYSTYFNNLELPPYYYYYNAGGWEGTLTRKSYAFYETTGVTYARYGGTVTCQRTQCSGIDSPPID